ncbi:hypothetical protein DEO72_LG5g2731 [Vigna unguiculata]|uniref:Uncharacterized protein n=1 Tax=Vigna unguiculata TaxID=3917 RepID=A0A4D6M382_VIGUN|nr:hypothetical protein DEO72_LG5g2731 [Vigna unguiculata]
MEVSPSASSCNSDGCMVASIAVVGFRGAFVVTVVTDGVATCHRHFSRVYCNSLVVVLVFARWRRPRLRFRATACREREREEKCAAWGRRRGAREFCALIKLYGLDSINN